MALWYRATDEWIRRSRAELTAKPGTKWHLVDLSCSDASTVIAGCGNGRRGDLSERASEVLYEEPTVIKRGEVIPTPGRGAVCKRCYKSALPA